MDDLKINKRLIMTPGPVSVDPAFHKQCQTLF